MAGERTFVVKFISDTLGFNKGIKKVSDDVNGIGGKLKTLVPSFRTIAVAGTAAFGAIAASSIKLVDMASNLEESQSKVNTVFGDSARVVNDFAKTSATSFGISKQAALEATGSFGALISAFGLGKSQASDMSVTLLKLAADLASFNNTNIEEAIGALRSGLSGETEPLKKYGVVLSDVLLKEKAREMQLYSGAGALGVTAKVQASYALILEQTAIQQGDVARTSGGFANQMKFLKASLSDVATEVGLVLLPYFKNFVTTLNQTVVPAIKVFAENFKEKGLGGALEMATAQMGEFGVSAVNVLESAYLALLQITNEVATTVRILANGAALAYGLKGNLVGAAKALAVAVAMKELQQATQEGLDNAGALFDGFRQRVYLASVELANFGKPPKDVSDSLDRMSQSTRSAALAGNNFIPVIKTAGVATGKAAKTTKDATEILKEYGKQIDSTKSSQDRFNKARKAEDKSLLSLTGANDRLAAAKAKLAQIERGFGAGSAEAKAAQVEVDRALRGQQRANASVEEAIYSVADAEANLIKVRKDPESSAMDIRRAELAVADAKLSVADSIDSQIDSTRELNKEQGLLNDTIYGATVGSILYDDALEKVEEAIREQVSAFEDWETAVSNTADAQDDFNDSLQETIDLITKYFKTLGSQPNPFEALMPTPSKGIKFNSFIDAVKALHPNSETLKSATPVADSKKKFPKLFADFQAGTLVAMAKGGLVKNPMAALIGEAGPELVIPLKDLNGLGGQTVNIIINSAIAEQGLPNKIVEALQQYNRTVGKVPVTTK
jgi:hypothetical protein